MEKYIRIIIAVSIVLVGVYSFFFKETPQMIDLYVIVGLAFTLLSTEVLIHSIKSK